MADNGTSPAASAQLDPAAARRAWRLAEPIHAMIYFAPEGFDRYTEVGLRGRRMGYFASRSAALGPVGAEVVLATFYNFSPAVVTRAIPAAWEFATPAAVLGARRAAADAVLRRALAPALGTPELAEAAELAGRAARAACDHVEGRPLFAAHAALDWPTEPHLALWHAQTLLREFRGDGHIAALVVEGVSGLEALVLHAATGAYPAEAQRTLRGWTEQEWAAAVDGLRARGLVAEGAELALTEAGRAHRQWVEDRTDALSVPAYGVLGDEGCARLAELARPLSRAIVDAGLLPGQVAATVR